ncbi:tRNA (adenine(22)-N(1))-methyltransferase TrmK [Thalassomonas viridans]|uniref:tRNA (Adenine(22)-N(1))-methyltransferase TrmK n=1 Tax=Thalassomonas viridans TaxID=137584 RepID=A0AAF0C8R4_9GAMM|nr:tRNA (adenine(22)-N(1))-methyltransferase TrmK [Thalassomonas viridans]WDE06717.1 tRNA (adenine(22)-N(1))-methyltransferase TrmK [Thalassomonas viridans]
MKTGKRLSLIDQMITSHYPDIWDCCCDHGFLGMSLIKRQAADTVHFVDINPPIIAQLEHQLRQHFPQDESRRQTNWRVYCADVARLPLFPAENTPGGNVPLIIIAGVGGDLLTELVEKIIRANPKQALEFILCPVHHNYKVRQTLIKLELGLIDEVLVKENRRFYEILHVATRALTTKQLAPVSVVGAKMWDFSQVEHRQYLSQTLAHYRRMQKNPRQEVAGIISDYQHLLSASTNS